MTHRHVTGICWLWVCSVRLPPPPLPLSCLHIKDERVTIKFNNVSHHIARTSIKQKNKKSKLDSKIQPSHYPYLDHRDIRFIKPTMAHCGWEKKLRSLGWEPRAVDDSPCSPGADLPEYSRKPSDLWYSFGYFARWQEFHRSKFCFRGTFNFSTPHPPSQSSDVCHKHWMRLLFKVIWRIQFRLDFFCPKKVEDGFIFSINCR